MVAADRRQAYARLLRFYQTIASFSSSVELLRFDRRSRCGSPTQSCQDSFSRSVLSSAANIAAYYFGAGTVNFDLASIDQISPAERAGVRDFRCRGIMRERHRTPVRRLHMYRPERLHRWLRLSADSLSGLPLRCLRCLSRSVSARILAFCRRFWPFPRP
jgi:hypothetical protein